ncbi:MAG TPA: SRPBCC family protein [Mycobacteriales bacterium]|nr:SRPBCC family protein [Mycobacteriales bacterium]
MEILAEAVSDAPPERVFALLAAGDRWQEWAGPMVPRSRWEVSGEPEGAVGAVRRLGVGPFVSRERITAHEAPRRLCYVVDSPAPYRDYRSEVTLTRTAEGGTAVRWASSFEPRVPGTGRLLAWFLQRVVAGFARNLARRA